MKIFVNTGTGEETIVTDPNHYSIYQRYGYEEKKVKVNNSKKETAKK